MKVQAIALFLLLFVAAGAKAQESVTVDLSVNNGPAANRASGFLHGISSSAPNSSLVNAMKAKFYRMDDNSAGTGGSNLGIAPALYSRIAAQGAKTEYIIGDAWIDNVDGKNPSNLRVVDSSSMSNFLAMVTDIVNNARSNGQTVQWDIWNEPDNTAFWTGSESQYQTMWQNAVNTIRSIDSTQVIVGPSTCGCIQQTYSGWSTWATDLLAFAKANNVLPNVISLHENDSVEDLINDANAAKAYLAANDPGITQIEINEFASTSETYLPGPNVHYFAAIERAKLSAAAHSCWYNDCFDYSLDGILGSDSSTTHAEWFAYQAYAEITGNIVGVTPSATVDGVAGQDANAKQVYSVFGRNGGSTENVTVNFTNLSAGASFLNAGGSVHVTAYVLPNDNGNGSSGPTQVVSSDYPVSSNAVSVTVPNVGADDVAIVQLTPGAAANNPPSPVTITAITVH